ncbi:flagellar biosynthesis protein FlgM [Amedibacterium intestinale]|uniref:flagellar biosynthesis protein FlgM n=1 Tax=Amedibacterium intestinale TaxID=2583452 RepID=UPI0022E84CBB|nr:flagellar biosynthesis protein FlgM [Amedibacterium intestinale]
MKERISMSAVEALLITGWAKELKVTTAENLKVEYGEELDNTKLFNAKESDENVKVDKVEGFDAKKMGEQEITVTFTDDNKDKEEKLKITVEDTKKPVIELKKESVGITAGDKLELKDNIKSVKDPVDGDLKYSDKTVEKDGYYIDKGKLDTKKAGTYEVKVIAADKNGNKTEKSFKVNVKKKETAKKPNGTGNSNTSNNGGSSSSNPSNTGNSGSNTGSSSGGSNNSSNSNGGLSNNGGGQKPVNPAPHQHSITVTGYPDVVYSNMWFEDDTEAMYWASNYEGPNGDWAGFGYSSDQCSCGMWSPYFFNVTTWE